MEGRHYFVYANTGDGGAYSIDDEGVVRDHKTDGSEVVLETAEEMKAALKAMATYTLQALKDKPAVQL